MPPINNHPGGRSAAKRRVLDAIGCGDLSPYMNKATRDSMLREGLIEQCGERLIGRPPFQVRIAEYQMPIHIHMMWCRAVSEEEPGHG